MQRFREEVRHVVVGANVKHLEKTVTHLVTDVIPPRLESFGVDIRRWIVCGKDSPLVVTKDGARCTTIGDLSLKFAWWFYAFKFTNHSG